MAASARPSFRPALTSVGHVQHRQCAVYADTFQSTLQQQPWHPALFGSGTFRPLSPVHAKQAKSMDLDESAVLEGWIPGEVYEVSSVQQIHDIALQNTDRKVILMCKSKSCRPCKAFSVKFKRLAAHHTATAFLSVTGESSHELRDLMIGMKIRNTPTFVGFWGGAIVHRHSGISKERMEAVLDSDWQQFADELTEKDVGDSLLSL